MDNEEEPTKWVWPEPRSDDDFIIEPHELNDEIMMRAVRTKLPEDVFAKLLADKEVEYMGKRWVIRPVLRLRRIDPEEWRRAGEVKLNRPN